MCTVCGRWLASDIGYVKRRGLALSGMSDMRNLYEECPLAAFPNCREARQRGTCALSLPGPSSRLAAECRTEDYHLSGVLGVHAEDEELLVAADFGDAGYF